MLCFPRCISAATLSLWSWCIKMKKWKQPESHSSAAATLQIFSCFQQLHLSHTGKMNTTKSSLCCEPELVWSRTFASSSVGCCDLTCVWCTISKTNYHFNIVPVLYLTSCLRMSWPESPLRPHCFCPLAAAGRRLQEPLASISMFIPLHSIVNGIPACSLLRGWTIGSGSEQLRLVDSGDKLMFCF